MFRYISIFIIVVSFIIYSVFFIPKDKQVYVKKVLSPVEIILDSDEKVELENFETFDSTFTERNKELAKKFNLTEEEAFILGNFAKNWAKNLLEGREVYITDNDLIFYKFSYYEKFWNTPYCIKDGEITNKEAFQKQLNTIRKQKYVLLNTQTNVVYPIDKTNAKTIKYYLVVPKRYAKLIRAKETEKVNLGGKYKSTLDLGDIKIIVSDNTSKILPDKNCSSDICREILKNINYSKESIDIAIYGYSQTFAIENAIKEAIKRGVKIRLVYDLDSSGENIYPDTKMFTDLIKDKNCDINSSNPNYIMHNKFYIFDNKTVITGSANLSHTDMSGFNTNSIIVLKSPKAANIYKTEFEQMFSGKFHNDKIGFEKEKIENIDIYFSPYDNGINDGILPVINGAKKYIYIPVFLITEPRIISSLINAKERGVDIKVIVDASNASNKTSRHRELRNAGIKVKTENYAGKMHSKTIIVDDEYLVIGSMNFSKSGEKKNDENMIVLKNKEAAKFYKEFFLYQWNRIPDKWLKYNVRAESKDSIGSCFDGLDNNYDGLIDSEDLGCKN